MLWEIEDVEKVSFGFSRGPAEVTDSLSSYSVASDRPDTGVNFWLSFLGSVFTDARLKSSNKDRVADADFRFEANVRFWLSFLGSVVADIRLESSYDDRVTVAEFRLEADARS